jgi:hypothetical protein
LQGDIGLEGAITLLAAPLSRDSSSSGGGDMLLLFSDRARCFTHAMIAAADGHAAPLSESDSALRSDSATLLLVRLCSSSSTGSSGGCLVQATEHGVRALTADARQLAASDWRAPQPLQHAATASTNTSGVTSNSSSAAIALLAVASDRELSLLAVHSSNSTSRIKADVTVVARHHFTTALSALALHTDRLGVCYIAAAHWDSDAITILRVTTAGSVTVVMQSVLPSVSSVDSSHVRQPRSLVFVDLLGSAQQQQQPLLAAGLADGSVVICDWHSCSDLSAMAHFQASREPVTLTVYPQRVGATDSSNSDYSAPPQHQYLYVSGDVDIVVRANPQRQHKQHNANEQTAAAAAALPLLVCTRVCNTAAGPRRSLLSLSIGTGRSDDFAWLEHTTTTNSSNSTSTTSTDSSNGGCTLCFATLSFEEEGQWRSSLIQQGSTALHVLVAPAAGCIVLAVQASCGRHSVQLYDAASLQLLWQGGLRSAGVAITALALMTVGSSSSSSSSGSSAAVGSQAQRQLIAVSTVDLNCCSDSSSVECDAGAAPQAPRSTVTVFELTAQQASTQLQPCGAVRELAGGCYCMAALRQDLLVAAVNCELLVLGWRAACSSSVDSAQLSLQQLCSVSSASDSVHSCAACVSALSCSKQYVAAVTLLSAVTLYKHEVIGKSKQQQHKLVPIAQLAAGWLLCSCIELLWPDQSSAQNATAAATAAAVLPRIAVHSQIDSAVTVLRVSSSSSCSSSEHEGGAVAELVVCVSWQQKVGLVSMRSCSEGLLVATAGGAIMLI